jgi:hypothetical protein
MTTPPDKPFNFADISKSPEPYKRKSRAKDPNNPGKGGRPAGSLNKRTVAAIEKAKANAPVVQKLSLTSLRETARYLGSAMALKQPWQPDGQPRPGGDYKMFMELAVLQLRYLEAITPYEAPRLAAIAMMPQGEQRRTIVNCTILDERGGKVYSDAVIDGDATEVEKQPSSGAGDEEAAA